VVERHEQGERAQQCAVTLALQHAAEPSRLPQPRLVHEQLQRFLAERLLGLLQVARRLRRAERRHLDRRLQQGGGFDVCWRLQRGVDVGQQ